MAETFPYMNAYGTISRVLEKVKSAATPSRFTQDFLATKLGFPGGTPKPVIPFLKRVGFLGSDGVPTDIYKRFRNPAESGSAAAEALKVGYERLYEMNEYAHDLDDEKLRGLIVQATGLEATSSTVRGILGSFKALKEFASFDEDVATAEPAVPHERQAAAEDTSRDTKTPPMRLGLSYTINLNLPSTSRVCHH